MLCCCGCYCKRQADNIERCEDFQHAFFRAFFRRRGRVAFFRPFSAAFNTFPTAGTLEFVAFFPHPTRGGGDGEEHRRAGRAYIRK